jgi:hypothetical protein
MRKAIVHRHIMLRSQAGDARHPSKIEEAYIASVSTHIDRIPKTKKIADPEANRAIYVFRSKGPDKKRLMIKIPNGDTIALRMNSTGSTGPDAGFQLGIYLLQTSAIAGVGPNSRLI